MYTKPLISTEACLLIFDPHENADWVRKIVQKEHHRVTHLLLGGDYFDRLPDHELSGVDVMCDLLLELSESWGDRLTVLLGNHDVHYVEAKRWCDMQVDPTKLNYRCGGYTNDKARIISRKLSWDFWRGCRLFQKVNGFLVSHGGIAKRFWHHELEVETAVDALEGHCQVVIEQLPYHNFAILGKGHARGGTEEQGGITWLDFECEFLDSDIPVPQIVGHTASRRGARQIGRSFCLDGAQSCYGILWRTGELEILAAD